MLLHNCRTIVPLSLILLLLAVSTLYARDNWFTHDNRTWPLYPETVKNQPDIPSPLTVDGREIVTCFTVDKQYAFIDITIANDDSLNYRENLWLGKGRQLDVDAADFPTLAKTGLHSEAELDTTRTITGKAVAAINDIARPEQYSGMGFIAADEGIIAVLRGDNRLVQKLGTTHPELARPLFHVWNVIQAAARQSKKMPVGENIEGIFYNGKKIYLQVWGALGWQESIFNDEILGYWEIQVWREPSKQETDFIKKNYDDLTERERESLLNRLTYIHTGEMVPFYIMRYGFYEGHTGYRADPVSILSVFGLRDIGALHNSTGNLYKTLTTHFTE